MATAQRTAAIILAAGEGKRLKSSVPKVLRQVCGRPMIEYVIRAIREAGVSNVGVVLGANEPAVKPFLPRGVRTARQPRPLGTADAVWSARKLFSSTKELLVFCGDAPLITSATIRQLIRTHRRLGASATLLTAHRHPPKDYGRVVRDASDLVIRITEEKEASAAELGITEINSGAYCFDRRELFKWLPKIRRSTKTGEKYLTDLVQLFRRDGRLIGAYVVPNADEVLGVNHPQDLVVANKVLRTRVIQQLWDKGVMITDPKTTFIDDGVEVGTGTSIEPYTVIEHGVKIGEHCRLGPFCRVRRGTVVDDHVVLGSFVEVSQSRIGRGTTALRLAYLGQAQVGRDVVVGAGTVTANGEFGAGDVTKIRDRAVIQGGTVLSAAAQDGKLSVAGRKDSGKRLGRRPVKRTGAWRALRA